MATSIITYPSKLQLELYCILNYTVWEKFSQSIWFYMYASLIWCIVIGWLKMQFASSCQAQTQTALTVVQTCHNKGGPDSIISLWQTNPPFLFFVFFFIISTSVPTLCSAKFLPRQKAQCKTSPACKYKEHDWIADYPESIWLHKSSDK